MVTAIQMTYLSTFALVFVVFMGMLLSNLTFVFVDCTKIILETNEKTGTEQFLVQNRSPF